MAEAHGTTGSTLAESPVESFILRVLALDLGAGYLGPHPEGCKRSLDFPYGPAPEIRKVEFFVQDSLGLGLVGAYESAEAGVEVIHWVSPNLGEAS